MLTLVPSHRLGHYTIVLNHVIPALTANSAHVSPDTTSQLWI
jgi:hypothetical protein